MSELSKSMELNSKNEKKEVSNKILLSAELWSESADSHKSTSRDPLWASEA